MIDVENLCAQIAALATNEPGVGLVYPRVSIVRDQLGEKVAAAYGFAGGSRIFSDQPESRKAARWHFAHHLNTNGKMGAENQNNSAALESSSPKRAGTR